ncbi:MAG: hypothetical protein WCF24_12365 [Acidimicrobiales bacterium]
MNSPRWEYEVFDWSARSEFEGIKGTPGLKEKLNDLGSNGWEVVAVEHMADRPQAVSSFILKRALPTAP